MALADTGGSRIDGAKCLEWYGERYTRPSNGGPRGQVPEPIEKGYFFVLGTVLYEISTGRLLYQDLDTLVIRTRFAEKIFPSFDGIPEDVQRVILVCWMEEYHTADEATRDLSQLTTAASENPELPNGPVTQILTTS